MISGHLSECYSFVTSMHRVQKWVYERRFFPLLLFFSISTSEMIREKNLKKKKQTIATSIGSQNTFRTEISETRNILSMSFDIFLRP